MTDLQTYLQALSEELGRKHVEIMLYPAGGMIVLDACAECGYSRTVTATWRYALGGLAMSMAYIRSFYGVPAKRGGRIGDLHHVRDDWRLRRLAVQPSGAHE